MQSPTQQQTVNVEVCHSFFMLHTIYANWWEHIWFGSLDTMSLIKLIAMARDIRPPSRALCLASFDGAYRCYYPSAINTHYIFNFYFMHRLCWSGCVTLSSPRMLLLVSLFCFYFKRLCIKQVVDVKRHTKVPTSEKLVDIAVKDNSTPQPTSSRIR